MSDWIARHIYLLLGLFFLANAIGSVWAGRTLTRYSGWIYRVKRPHAFWWAVTVYVVFAIICIVVDWLKSLLNS
jgi:MFS family permease